MMPTNGHQHPVWVLVVKSEPSEDGNGDVTIFYTLETRFDIATWEDDHRPI